MTTSISPLLGAAAGLALAVSGAVAGLPAQAAGTPLCTNADLTASYHGGDGAAGTPLCTNADLTASYRGGDGAAGTVYGRIVLRNTSDHACHTGGYGGISYVGHGDGTQIGAPARRIDRSDVATYVLRPGQRLRSPIGETEALNYPRKRCHPTHVDGFRIYVPNATKAQYVAHPTTGCRNPHVKLISQKPYRRP